jgi:hypothetical protein
MIEGSGSGSIPLTSGSGSGRPKNMWIRIRIRIRNTDAKICCFSIASIGTECDGTTVGLGYLEVSELSMQILLVGQLASVGTVNSQWGRRIQFLY